MEFDQTQPLPTGRGDSRQIYRCPCGTDVDIDQEKGGTCAACNRFIPGSVTRMSMTMTLSDLSEQRQPVAPADDQPDDLIGKTLGHFKIIKPIGRGGMGQVYRALDTSLQRYVAVKVIKGSVENSIDSQGKQRLMHEAVAQARVTHPNIVTIYYVGQQNEQPFLAMELVDGFDASQLIKQGDVPYETVCSIALKITDALNVASQTGIIHSDIKPQNLLILKDGNIKLSDFGMASLNEDDRANHSGGTPNYLAPELLASGKPSIQSDMYALGVTLYELSFGRLPVLLSGLTLSEWSKIHKETEVEFPTPWPDHLPERWKNVLQKLLAKAPGDRYESYTELSSELKKISPIRRTNAFVLARSIAFVIDFVILVAIFGGMLGLTLLLTQAIGNVRGSNIVWASLPGFVGTALYFLVVYFWRQSVGRELVHVKVVNQYSLTPTRKTMLLRELLRMNWIVLVGFAVLGEPFWDGSDTVANLLIIFLIFANLVYTIFIGRGQSIHDRIMRTRAVIGSDTQ